MTLWLVPIDSITEEHLQYLIDDQVAENRSIEYKRELPGNTDVQKKEFLADVCAFANAAGAISSMGSMRPTAFRESCPGSKSATWMP